MSRSRTILRPAALLAVLVAAAGCSPAPADDPGKAAAEEPPPPTDRIDVPASVRRNLGITFAEVEVRHVARTLRLPGAFELVPLARSEYRVALPGRVELLVDQYEAVEAGQVLFRYRSPGWSGYAREVLVADQDVARTRAEVGVRTAALAEARRRLETANERVAALAEASFRRADLEVAASSIEASLPGLEAELELARTDLENAAAAREHALRRAATASGISAEELAAPVEVDGRSVPRYLALDQIEVRAAEAGVVESLAVTDGAYVESAAEVLTTVDPARIRFRAQGLQADLPELVNVVDSRIVPPPAPGTPVDESLAAETTFGLEASPRERTIALIAHPSERAAWARPGVSAFLELVIESTEAPALAVPAAAVVRDGLTHVLFRRDPANPNQVIRIEADLGVGDGRWVELLSGVRAGDEVVLAGVYELKLASQQSGATQKGGHFHADGSFHGEH